MNMQTVNAIIDGEVQTTEAHVGRYNGIDFILYKDTSSKYCNVWKAASYSTGMVFQMWPDGVQFMDMFSDICGYLNTNKQALIQREHKHTVDYTAIGWRMPINPELCPECGMAHGALGYTWHKVAQTTEGLNAQERTEHADMTEALIVAESALTYAIFDGAFPQTTKAQIQQALQQVRDVLKLQEVTK